MDLKRQAEGQANIRQRKSEAYSSIQTAKYRGSQKNFTFDAYISRHHKAHADLAHLLEPVSEGKKVEDFLLGILDSRLQNAKNNIVGDTIRSGNFEACQQYLKTILISLRQSDRRDRTVSGVTTPSNGDNPRKGAPTTRGDYPSKDAPNAKLKASTYSSDVWATLSKSQIEKIQKLRKAKAREKRKVSAAQSKLIVVDSDESDEEAATGDAGDQFGRGKKKKAGKRGRKEDV